MTTEELREWYLEENGIDPEDLFGDGWEQEVRRIIVKLDSIE